MASKSRKSLATFAAVSLGLGSVFVGSAPAQAVVAVSLAPSDGTSYTVESNYDMSLETLITNSALSGGTESIKFLITDLDAGLEYAEWTNGEDTEGSYPVDEDGIYDIDSDTLLVDSVVAASENVALAQTLTLVPEETDTFSVTVQAWVDFNDNNVIDEGEAQSSVRTVTFVNEDDIDWSLNFAAPSLGDDELTATVTSSPALNLDVMGDYQLEVAFATYNASGGDNKFTAISPSAESGTDGEFTDGEMADDDGVYAASEDVASGTYTAVVIFNGDEVTPQAYRQVAVSVADDYNDDLELVKTANTDGDDVYRVGTASVTLTVSFEDEDNDPVPAGTVVTVTLSDDDLADDTSIKSGGKTLEAGGDDVSYTTTTDADGVVTIVVTGLSEQEDGDSFNVAVRSGSVTTDLDVDAEDTDVDYFSLMYSLGEDSVVKIAEGGTTTVKFFAFDQFRQPLGSDYRVKLTDGQDVTKVANLSGQVATFSITDDADVDENWTASLQMDDDFNWVDTGDYASFDNLVIGDSNAPANVTTSDDQTGDYSVGRADSDDLRAWDWRVDNDENDINWDNSSDEITGIVTDATGVGTYSAVTISAPGVYFMVVDSNDNWVVLTKDSATVYTDESGSYGDVYAVSNTAGDVTVTVTAGSASAELVIEFDGASDDEGTDLTVNVANAVAGSTMIISGSLVDVYGNPVAYGDLTIDYDGPGFAANIPDDTDANGNYKFAVLLGANDKVSGTVTVTYTEGEEDITVSRNLVVTDTKVNVGSFKGYVALYAKGYEGQKMSAIVAGKWIVVASLATDFERVVRFTGAGYDIVATIYIDGVMIDTFNITTK